MIRAICFILVVIQSFWLAECKINQYELNSLFNSVHKELMAERNFSPNPAAVRLSFNKPGAFVKQPLPSQQPKFNPNEPQIVNMMNSFNKFTPNSININNMAMTGLGVAEKLLNDKLRFESNPMETLQQIQAPSKFCPFKNTVKCDVNFPYRAFDGSCNSLTNPWWGQAEMPFKRWMEADYSDRFKLNEPRTSLDGSELPNPRDLSCALHTDAHQIEPFINHIFMQWGQFINHDITSLSITRDDDPDKTVCNTCTKSKKCLPILIRSNETCNCVSQMRHPCIEFTRSSATFGDVSCQLGKREQLNLQTSWIDGSLIYGIKQEDVEKLRDRQSGKGLMLVQKRGFKNDLLPKDNTPKPSDCLDFTNETRCFLGGDERVNQNPALMSMHTLFVREHNRIATILSQLNPTWQDETVFQEARRIIIAILQHITYNEFLPILLGPNTMERFGLNPLRNGEQSTFYDPKTDPRISNEYSASAGRYGHSMIRTQYSRVNSNYEHSGSNSFLLRNGYFRANGLYDTCQGGLESIIRGMIKDPLMKVDRHFSSEITQHLFETIDRFSRPFHFDLVSINIARGRDHGIPGYTKFREFCGLPPVKSWNDMRNFVQNDVVNILMQFYRFVEDVDLFVAVTSELKEEGSIVGPTLTCLLGLQYRDLKFGDRFWYETADFPANFTPEQLNEIRKVSLSKFLCRTMNDTPRMPPRAFLSFRLPGNELVDCDQLPDIDWNFWRA